MYLWRAVDHEGGALDILVQRRRDTRVALRLMRKLFKKQGFVPKLLVTDKLRSYVLALQRLRLTCPHEQGFGKTIGRRIRTRQSDDASANCSGSSQLDPPSNFLSTQGAVHNTVYFQRHLPPAVLQPLRARVKAVTRRT